MKPNDYSVGARKCTIAEMETFPNMHEVLAAYAKESLSAGLPAAAPSAERYKRLEAAGMEVYCAFHTGIFIGYITVLAPVIPHFERVIASVESFFVLAEYRSTGAGTLLRELAENYAQYIGSPGLFMNARLGSDLCALLPRAGYQPLSCTFYKNFSQHTVPAMKREAIEKVSALEKVLMTAQQVDVKTRHTFHAGVYARTITVPVNAVITGVLVRIPTLLIVEGDASMYAGDAAVELRGYNIIPAEAGRKQVFYARSEVNITMVFATSARTVEEAEAEFTEETSFLLSRRSLAPLSGTEICQLQQQQPSSPELVPPPQ